METKTVKITRLEKEFLDTLESCDHSSDGHGICGYPFDGYGLDNKVHRGVLASLVKKGVVDVDDVESTVYNKNRTGLLVKKDTWVCLNSQFVEEDPSNDWSGRKFVNLDWDKSILNINDWETTLQLDKNSYVVREYGDYKITSIVYTADGSGRKFVTHSASVKKIEGQEPVWEPILTSENLEELLKACEEHSTSTVRG